MIVRIDRLYLVGKFGKGCLQKKNYVDRETVPIEGRAVVPLPYKKHSSDREYSSIGRGLAKNSL